MDMVAAIGREVGRAVRMGVLALLIAVGVMTAAEASRSPAVTDMARGLFQTGPKPDIDPPGAISFTRPLPGRTVGSPFGLRQMPGEPAERLHAGIDIPAPFGSPVRCIDDGVVRKSGTSPGYGRYVEVAHPSGLTSLYAHLQETAAGVEPGAKLREGQVLGQVGSSGRSTGAHLHLEIRKDGVPLDPQRFIGRRFANLAELPIADAAKPPAVVHMAEAAKPVPAAPPPPPAVHLRWRWTASEV
jgi:murein DD-endopeptidase MepM/ murein hydrolase activator NlpD